MLYIYRYCDYCINICISFVFVHITGIFSLDNCICSVHRHYLWTPIMFFSRTPIYVLFKDTFLLSAIFVLYTITFFLTIIFLCTGSFLLTTVFLFVGTFFNNCISSFLKISLDMYFSHVLVHISDICLLMDVFIHISVIFLLTSVFNLFLQVLFLYSWVCLYLRYFAFDSCILIFS